VQTGQINVGIDHLRKGASLNSNYGPVWEHLGLAYQKQGRHKEAIKAFERATQIMPTYRLCWLHLADEYRAAGKVAEANRPAAHAQSLAFTISKRETKKHP
jgi:tetratricopeptide (TPR) repeat protein